MADTKLNIVIDAQNKANKAFGSVNNELESLSSRMKKFGGVVKKVAKIGTVAFGALATGIGFAVKEFAKFETAEVAFESMLGSADKAKEMMKDLQEFSAKTPFQFADIAKATRTLIAFGSTGEYAKEQIKFLGDISAGANVPLADLAQIFGKVQTKGKAMTEEILQMSERGIPIIDKLAKKYGVSKDAIFEMAETGQLTADVVNEALMSMTEEGEIFADQMAKQSETLAGKWSTLKDNILLAMAEIGDRFSGLAKDVLNRFIEITGSIRNFVANWEENKEKILSSEFFTQLSNAFNKVAEFFKLIWEQILKQPLTELRDTLIEIGQNEEYLEILKRAGTYIGKTLVVILAVLTVALAGVVVGIAKIYQWFHQLTAFLITGVGPAFIMLSDLVKFVFFGIMNVIKFVMSSTINFFISQINILIEMVNGIINKFKDLPKIGKLFKGIGNFETFDLVEPEFTDLSQFTGQGGKQPVVNQTFIQGNTFLDEQSAEKIGDMMLKETSLSTNMNF